MKVEIVGEFIKLGQLLKKLDLIPTGGMAKFFVKSHEIKINNIPSQARNAKIRPGDTVWIDTQVYKIVAKVGANSEKE
ncbi:ribosome-associated protein YbcJ (S4-like RNA binding protein) [Metamycoplasma subdolum]|uniref:Ribosome-associated protein YbcJ (S4-like RNA binding protein) n=1 Tax=Metamycoplasma subdolum TaxID=92407 RepID=A0A3M0A3I7_9BACT|nr:RNA-binding S4 domain-containing protein [Metamycoplasma subdolum]RMA79014.1 ribosome-associated protein YbcJ (S4-like RNA binding protein) [Metamycoplasma subdolum]WPB50537.1 RNA-binding S4 domain-containing protein [Metamycoplasma subdolum]